MTPEPAPGAGQPPRTRPWIKGVGIALIVAVWLLSRLGYLQDTAEELDADLREQVLSLDAAPGRPSPYGQKYEILGPLTGPNGKNAWVRTIWIVLTGETVPRLVTLIPAEKP